MEVIKVSFNRKAFNTATGVYKSTKGHEKSYLRDCDRRKFHDVCRREIERI